MCTTHWVWTFHSFLPSSPTHCWSQSPLFPNSDSAFIRQCLNHHFFFFFPLDVTTTSHFYKSPAKRGTCPLHFNESHSTTQAVIKERKIKSILILKEFQGMKKINLPLVIRPWRFGYMHPRQNVVLSCSVNMHTDTDTCVLQPEPNAQSA